MADVDAEVINKIQSILGKLTTMIKDATAKIKEEAAKKGSSMGDNRMAEIMEKV